MDDSYFKKRANYIRICDRTHSDILALYVCVYGWIKDGI